jgi:endonuclease III
MEDGMRAWPADDLLERFDDIVGILEIRYGPRPFMPNGDPTRTLVRTILSQSTNDRNSSAAFAALRDAFPTWTEVIEAPVAEVAAAIQIGGLANQKAPRLQQVLRTMRDEEVTAATLGAMPVDAAMVWLTSLEGVGPKTAALVLLFALGKPVMPVDTHIARVMTRLGMVPDRTGTVTKQRILTNLIGDDAASIYAVHVETIDHGRTICHARRPLCAACPLQDLCEYYLQVNSV